MMGEVIDARMLFEERQMEVEIERHARDYADLLTRCMAGELPCDTEPPYEP
jgi:hypothetical protein